MYIHRALPFDCSMYFASNDTLFNLLRIYFEHKVHSPQCNNALSDANYIQLDVVCIEGVGALKDWVLVAHQPTAPPVVWSIDGIDISLSVANSLVCAILLCGSQFLRVRSSKIMTLKLT